MIRVIFDGPFDRIARGRRRFRHRDRHVSGWRAISTGGRIAPGLTRPVSFLRELRSGIDLIADTRRTLPATADTAPETAAATVADKETA